MTIRLLLAAVLCAAGAARAVVTQDCALPGADCTLREVARQAHVVVGAIDNRTHGDAERAVLATHFTAATPENEMKWGVIAPSVGSYDFADADAIVDFAVAQGLRLRGHTLLWGRLQLPQDLGALVAAAPDPAARLRALVAEHFATMIGRYGDRVAVWDVVNEPLDTLSGAWDQNLFFQTLGSGWVAEAFALARALDPDAELFLNEFSILVPSAKADALVALVGDLRAAGVPVDGVGVQGHFFPGVPLTAPAALENFLRALGDTGVAVELTEVDVSLWHFRNDPDPLARQAEYFGQVAAACMAVPACRGLTFWGIDDPETWLDTFPPFDAAAPNRPLLFAGTLAPKPAYFAVRDAIAVRAIPFQDQLVALRLRYLASRRLGSLAGAEPGRPGRAQIRAGAKALSRTRRHLRRREFARACEAFAGVRTALATALGGDAPALRATAEALAADLGCDAP